MWVMYSGGLTVGYKKRPSLRLHASWLAALCMAVTSVVHHSAPARAETIASALSKAYVGNPQLKADQARQRATDEQVPQAKSGWRPTVTANSEVAKVYSNSSVSGKSDFLSRNFQINLSQPVFDGFRSENALREAEATVLAGSQNLLAVEQEVLLNGATAYMNVIRDREIVNYRRKSVENFDEQLRAANARFDVGEVTRTDVSQARARASEARSDLAVAIGNLQTSVANYIRVIGDKPRHLKFPRLSPRVPRTLRAAIGISGETNPQIFPACSLQRRSCCGQY